MAIGLRDRLAIGQESPHMWFRRNITYQSVIGGFETTWHPVLWRFPVWWIETMYLPKFLWDISRALFVKASSNNGQLCLIIVITLNKWPANLRPDLIQHSHVIELLVQNKSVAKAASAREPNYWFPGWGLPKLRTLISPPRKLFSLCKMPANFTESIKYLTIVAEIQRQRNLAHLNGIINTLLAF